MGQVKDEIEAWLASVGDVRCYPEKMKVYAPTCDGTCLPAVERLIDSINRLFEGSTVYDARGDYFDAAKGIMFREPVKVIEVGHHCTDKPRAERFAQALVAYAEEAGQGSIAIHQNDFFIAETPKLQEAFKKLKERVP